MTAAMKLLAVRKKYKLSYSEIGFKAYGTPGKVAVDFFLAFTQTLFCCAYVTFIVSTINTMLKAFKKDEINVWILGGIVFAVYVPLCFVRKIQKFAFFHIFADAAILIGVTIIIIYASMELHKNGGFSNDVVLINEKTFLSFVGLAAYTFEGIGIIIPVMETTSRPDLYPMVLAAVFIFLSTFYVFFGNFTYFVYGATQLETSPLITDLLPATKAPVLIIYIIWIINLIFTYPLVLHPAITVVESYLFKKMQKSTKKTWLQNLSRTVLVGLTVVLSVSLLETLDKLESLNGAFACIPLAFLLPNLFHYKLVAETRGEKMFDLSLVAMSLVLQIVCTVVTFMYWND